MVYRDYQHFLEALEPVGEIERIAEPAPRAGDHRGRALGDKGGQACVVVRERRAVSAHSIFQNMEWPHRRTFC